MSFFSARWVDRWGRMLYKRTMTTRKADKTKKIHRNAAANCLGLASAIQTELEKRAETENPDWGDIGDLNAAGEKLSEVLAMLRGENH